MKSNCCHLIEDMDIEITFESAAMALAEKNKIAHWVTESLLNAMHIVFDHYAGDDTILRFDRLEFDLGDFNSENYQGDIMNSIIRQLKAHIEACTLKLEPDTQQGVRETALHQLVFFLQTGIMPWHWGAQAVNRPPGEVVELTGHDISGTQSRVSFQGKILNDANIHQQLLQNNIGNSELTSALRQLAERSTLIERLLSQFSLMQQQQLLKSFAPEQYSNASALIDSVVLAVNFINMQGQNIFGGKTSIAVNETALTKTITAEKAFADTNLAGGTKPPAGNSTLMRCLMKNMFEIFFDEQWVNKGISHWGRKVIDECIGHTGIERAQFIYGLVNVTVSWRDRPGSRGEIAEYIKSIAGANKNHFALLQNGHNDKKYMSGSIAATNNQQLKVSIIDAERFTGANYPEVSGADFRQTNYKNMLSLHEIHASELEAYEDETLDQHSISLTQIIENSDRNRMLIDDNNLVDPAVYDYGVQTSPASAEFAAAGFLYQYSIEAIIQALKSGSVAIKADNFTRQLLIELIEKIVTTTVVSGAYLGNHYPAICLETILGASHDAGSEQMYYCQVLSTLIAEVPLNLDEILAKNTNNISFKDWQSNNDNSSEFNNFTGACADTSGQAVLDNNYYADNQPENNYSVENNPGSYWPDNISVHNNFYTAASNPSVALLPSRHFTVAGSRDNFTENNWHENVSSESDLIQNDFANSYAEDNYVAKDNHVVKGDCAVNDNVVLNANSENGHYVSGSLEDSYIAYNARQFKQSVDNLPAYINTDVEPLITRCSPDSSIVGLTQWADSADNKFHRINDISGINNCDSGTDFTQIPIPAAHEQSFDSAGYAEYPNQSVSAVMFEKKITGADTCNAASRQLAAGQQYYFNPFAKKNLPKNSHGLINTIHTNAAIKWPLTSKNTRNHYSQTNVQQKDEISLRYEVVQALIKGDLALLSPQWSSLITEHSAVLAQAALHYLPQHSLRQAITFNSDMQLLEDIFSICCPYLAAIICPAWHPLAKFIESQKYVPGVPSAILIRDLWEITFNRVFSPAAPLTDARSLQRAVLGELVERYSIDVESAACMAEFIKSMQNNADDVYSGAASEQLIQHAIYAVDDQQQDLQPNSNSANLLLDDVDLAENKSPIQSDGNQQYNEVLYGSNSVDAESPAGVAQGAYSGAPAVSSSAFVTELLSTQNSSINQRIETNKMRYVQPIDNIGTYNLIVSEHKFSSDSIAFEGAIELMQPHRQFIDNEPISTQTQPSITGDYSTTESGSQNIDVADKEYLTHQIQQAFMQGDLTPLQAQWQQLMEQHEKLLRQAAKNYLLQYSLRQTIVSKSPLPILHDVFSLLLPGVAQQVSHAWSLVTEFILRRNLIAAEQTEESKRCLWAVAIDLVCISEASGLSAVFIINKGVASLVAERRLHDKWTAIICSHLSRLQVNASSELMLESKIFNARPALPFTAHTNELNAGSHLSASHEPEYLSPNENVYTLDNPAKIVESQGKVGVSVDDSSTVWQRDTQTNVVDVALPVADNHQQTQLLTLVNKLRRGTMHLHEVEAGDDFWLEIISCLLNNNSTIPAYISGSLFNTVVEASGKVVNKTYFYQHVTSLLLAPKPVDAHEILHEINRFSLSPVELANNIAVAEIPDQSLVSTQNASFANEPNQTPINSVQNALSTDSPNTDSTIEINAQTIATIDLFALSTSDLWAVCVFFQRAPDNLLCTPFNYRQLEHLANAYITLNPHIAAATAIDLWGSIQQACVSVKNKETFYRSIVQVLLSGTELDLEAIALMADGQMAHRDSAAESIATAGVINKQTASGNNAVKQSIQANNSSRDTIIGSNKTAAENINPSTIALTNYSTDNSSNNPMPFGETSVQTATALASNNETLQLLTELLKLPSLSPAAETALHAAANKIIAQVTASELRHWFCSVLSLAEVERLILYIPGYQLHKLLMHAQLPGYSQLNNLMNIAMAALALLNINQANAALKQARWRFVFTQLFFTSRADMVKPLMQPSALVLQQLAGQLAQAAGLADADSLLKLIKQRLALNNKKSRPTQSSGENNSFAKNSAEIASPSILGTSAPINSITEAQLMEAMKNGVHIHNAGQVLAAPYLPRLFSTLALTEKGKFVNADAANRAAHLLQYMVTTQQQTPEFQLLLNKVLCGIGAVIPLSRGIDLSEHEIATLEQMLNSMVQHWKILGSTSIDGFRQTFLQRQGWLTLDEQGWFLQVHAGTFDMLLDQLPWNISIVKHGWMDRPLRVSWRN